MGFKTLRICPQAVHELTVCYGPADGWKDCIQSDLTVVALPKESEKISQQKKSDGLQEGSIPSLKGLPISCHFFAKSFKIKRATIFFRKFSLMKVMLVCLWFRGQLSFTCESFSSTLLVVLGSRNVYANCRYLQNFSGDPICSTTKILVSCCNSISCSNVGVDMKFKAHEYDCEHFTVKYYNL